MGAALFFAPAELIVAPAAPSAAATATARSSLRMFPVTVGPLPPVYVDTSAATRFPESGDGYLDDGNAQRLGAHRSERTSSASRRPSPSRLKASVVSTSAPPGKIISHQAMLSRSGAW